MTLKSQRLVFFKHFREAFGNIFVVTMSQTDTGCTTQHDSWNACNITGVCLDFNLLISQVFLKHKKGRPQFRI